MKFLVLTRNSEDKIYKITGVSVDEKQKEKYEKIIQAFNNGLHLNAIGEFCRNEYDEKKTIEKWRTSMEIISYEESSDCVTPKLI